MFESDDFEVDEDFLKDVSAKEEEYYSQRAATEEKSQAAKRRKTEVDQSDIWNEISDDEPDFLKVSKKSSRIEYPENDITESPSAPLDRAGDKSNATDFSKNANSAVPSRTDLALRFFKSGETAQSEEESAVSNRAPPTHSSVLSKINCSEKVDSGRRNRAIEILRKASGSYEKHSTAENENSSWSAEPGPSAEKNQRKSLTEILKPSENIRPPESPGKMLPPKRFSKLSKIAAPRTGLVRKFPGPAGLLPDSPDSIGDASNFLNPLNECDVESNQQEDPNMTEYYSQNTEKLFNCGPWRAMLDDLPANFLQGHDIATIKRNACRSSGNSRISFLAGVIQRIDHCVENPRLCLRDASDSIEGTMHADISLAHPNIFEPGAVILLRNAGLLAFKGPQNVQINQFHIMISPQSLLAVYTEKSERLVLSPWMRSIIGDTERSEKNSAPAPSSSKADPPSNDPKPTEHSRDFPQSHDSTDNKKSFPTLDQDPEISFDDSFDMENIENLEIPDRNSTQNHSKSLAKSFSNEEPAKISGNCATPKTKNTPVQSPTNDLSRISIDERTTEKPSGKDDKNKGPKERIAGKSKLAQFRCKEVLTPPVCRQPEADRPEEDPIPETREIPKNQNSRGFGQDLLDSSGDSDDEILSQLDIDSIVRNYNANKL